MEIKPKLHIVKIGGNVIDKETHLEQFLEQFAALEGQKILVHGGGKLATEMAAQLAIPQQMIDGRRVTDADTLKIVTMVYAGYINKNITARLQACGCNAVGLSGADGNLIQAHQRKGGQHDYGFAGDVDRVNTSFALRLLAEGCTLVIAPITHDAEGQLLNTNADTIAQELAQALSLAYAVQLVYCFEKTGVLRDLSDEGSVISRIGQTDFVSLQEQGIIHSGMLPKLHNAFAALDKGVQAVVIGSWEQLPALAALEAGTAIIHD